MNQTENPQNNLDPLHYIRWVHLRIYGAIEWRWWVNIRMNHCLNLLHTNNLSHCMLVFAGGIAASILSIAIGEPTSESFDRGGTSKNSKTNWFDTTFTGWIVWWMQKGSRMCYLYDWIQCWWLDSNTTLYT